MRKESGGSGRTVRTFVAVDTSPEVKAELSCLLSGLMGKTRLNVKWVKPEQMHLTLAFLGEVAAEFIERTKEQLAAVAVRFAPIRCQLSGLGAFPDPARARVLWTGVTTGDKEIKGLQKEVSRALGRIGYLPEKRAFTPHLTLGRIRDFGDARFIQEIKFVSSEWQIDRLTLYRSELYPDGPVYTPLAQFFLKG